MHCGNLKECFEQINAYLVRSSIGFPLIVNTDNYQDYQEIAHRLQADETKQCISVSAHTYQNGLPNIQAVIAVLKGDGAFAVFGISHALMLQGKEELDSVIGELLDYSIEIKGHAVVLLSHCRIYLEKYLQRDYTRLDRRIVFLDGEKTPLPQLKIAKSKDECVWGRFSDGIMALLSDLEHLTDAQVASHPTITVLTSFSPDFFRNSVYSVSMSGGVYDTLVERLADLAGVTERSFGTEQSWAWLLKQVLKSKSFSHFIVSRFGPVTGLAQHLGDVWESGDENTKWLLWLALKVFRSEMSPYLHGAVSLSETYKDLTHHIYQDILEVPYGDTSFHTLYKERKQLLARLPENLPELASYCAAVGRHGKQAVFYLTDATDDEKYIFMQTIDQYEWTEEELSEAIRHALPDLALYMEDFTFEPLNTRLADKDAPLRDTLSNYFHRYKNQKIRNRIDDDFLQEVNRFALERPFYKLQPRSAILAGMDKKGCQAYFFDAFGVEYLAYIQAKCEEYGMIYEVSIGHCELPSITARNKEFQYYFDPKTISDLDELKHHSLIYDYEKCTYPIHIFRELEIIALELRRIRSQLVQRNFEKAVIFSDHGASRLAVIYKHESTAPLELEEKGKHSGRCCPCSEDPGIPQAAYEDGFAVLANYERFRGGRKANLEVHGGASLEEVVVPVITLSLRPDDINYSFVDSIIKYKIGHPATIELFSNAPMKQPRLEIEGTFYDGVMRKDKNHALFTLTDQKRAREYNAAVYEGNLYVGVTLTFRIERKTKTRDLFN